MEFPGAGGNCRNLSGCLLPQAYWQPGGPTHQGRGQLEVYLENLCSGTLRVALWVPEGGGYKAEHFQIWGFARMKRTVLATRNEWRITVAEPDAPDACLSLPRH